MSGHFQNLSGHAYNLLLYERQPTLWLHGLCLRSPKCAWIASVFGLELWCGVGTRIKPTTIPDVLRVTPQSRVARVYGHLYDLNCRLLKLQVGIKKFVYQDMRGSRVVSNNVYTFSIPLKTFINNFQLDCKGKWTTLLTYLVMGI